MNPTLTMSLHSDPEEPGGPAAGTRPALVLAWSRDEPERVGEVCLLPAPGRPAELRVGRAPDGADGHARGEWMRQRPGANEPTGPLRSPHVSREQLVFTVGDGLRVRNVGRCPLEHNGEVVAEAEPRPGDVLELRGAAVFLVTTRPAGLPPAPAGAVALPPASFGQADRFGFVGESPAAWALRHQIAFMADRPAHVLVRGPSGSGKELVSTALHRLSARGGGPLVARNAATIPETLVDAELFGNARNYPNAGMPERPGLVGEAHGGTLFLDEFAELPRHVQAHLLRVLDAGEYQRLGESRVRHSDFRLVAATNRPESALKEDVLARFRLRIEIPGLDTRREDVPLVARALLARLAARDPSLRERWFAGSVPRFSARFVAALLRRPWTTHARELEALLWQAMLQARGDSLDLVPELAGPSAGPPAAPTATPSAGHTDPQALSREQVLAALERHGGSQSAAWKALGLSSRFVLLRLMKRHGIPGAREGA